MGMFDNITVTDQLPFSQEMIDLGLDKNVRTFQTKDLENSLSEYYIQNGELFEKDYKNEKWIKGDPKAKSFIDRFGYMESTDEFLKKVDFHGIIYFYDNQYDVEDKWDCWVEFKAVFTNSKLDRIELFKFEKTDSEERKLRSKEWQENLERERNLWRNKYFFDTMPFRWFKRKIYNKIANGIVSIGRKMGGY
jgi:hypothetical protein